MKTLVIGGKGFIGSALISALNNVGIETVIWSSHSTKPEIDEVGHLAPHATIPDGTKRILFLAQSPYFRNFPDHSHHLFQVNSVLPLHVATMAAECGIEHFTFFSTGSVYAPSFSPISENYELDRSQPYSLSKIHGEECFSLLESKMKVLILRPFFAFGPGQQKMLIPQLAERIRQGAPLVLHRSTEERDTETRGLVFSPIFIRDLVKITLDLLQTQKVGTYNIAGDRPTSIFEIGQCLARILDVPLKTEYSNQLRRTDHVADISKLKSAVTVQFSDLQEALEMTFAK